jgi:hypothetical protein
MMARTLAQKDIPMKQCRYDKRDLASAIAACARAVAGTEDTLYILPTYYGYATDTRVPPGGHYVRVTAAHAEDIETTWGPGGKQTTHTVLWTA